MKMKIVFFLLFIVQCVVTHVPSFGQVSMCDVTQSSHPLDVYAMHMKDSLHLMGIDTCIIYRNWQSTNTFNGYGKVIWLDGGTCYQSKYECVKNYSGTRVVQESFGVLRSDSLFRFPLDNRLHFAAQPTEQAFSVDHDTEHYVEVNYKTRYICFFMRGTLAQQNPDNLRTQFVRLLCDGDLCLIQVDKLEVGPIFFQKSDGK